LQRNTLSRTPSRWVGFSWVGFILCGGALLATVSACHRPNSPNVVATVNGKEIQRSEMEKYYKARLASSAQTPSAEQADIMRLNTLRSMIEEEILWQRAAQLNLAASDEDVNAKLTEYKAPYTQEEWDKQLQAQGISLDDFKRDLRRQLTQTKLLNKEIESKININDAEIAAFYAAHKSEFNYIEPRYRLAQIAVSGNPAQPTGNPQNRASSDADAKKKIQELHRRLENGEDFSALAITFSENPDTAPSGGDMGFIPESQLRGSDLDLFNTINRLKPGEITDIIPLYNNAAPNHRVMGYAIYKLIAKEAAGQRELNDPRVQQAIRQGLRENHAQLLQNAYLEVLHNEAKIHNYFAEQVLKQGAQ